MKDRGLVLKKLSDRSDQISRDFLAGLIDKAEFDMLISANDRKISETIRAE